MQAAAPPDIERIQLVFAQAQLHRLNSGDDLQRIEKTILLDFSPARGCFHLAIRVFES
jgi:hypothetical protein